jgi:hypothetical protein
MGVDVELEAFRRPACLVHLTISAWRIFGFNSILTAPYATGFTLIVERRFGGDGVE